MALPPEFTFRIEVSSFPNRLALLNPLALIPLSLIPLALIVTFPKGATVSGLVSFSLAIFVSWLIG